jgi:polysaccharide export outer membrane protein
VTIREWGAGFPREAIGFTANFPSLGASGLQSERHSCEAAEFFVNMRSSLFLRQVAVFLTSAAFGCSMVLAQPETSSYVLKPNDVVKLVVFNEEALTSQTRVLQTGEAMLPLIGPVKVAGLTLSDAIEKVRALYDADYLVNPKVTLTVDEYAQQQVSVLGSVRVPGAIPIPPSGKLDLAAAIATAGGLTEAADASQISLTRANGQMTVFTRAAIERGAKVPLTPGDRIVVAESRFVNQSVTFVGEVKKPGAIQFPLNGDLDIVTAIAQVGGLTDMANPKKVSVNRKGKVIVVDVKEASSKGSVIFKLEPNDIVTIPSRLF